VLGQLGELPIFKAMLKIWIVLYMVLKCSQLVQKFLNSMIKKHAWGWGQGGEERGHGSSGRVPRTL
jgi:hypothetical protein